MKRSLKIAFGTAIAITILIMGQPLYAQNPRPTQVPNRQALAAPTPQTACCTITAIDTSTGVVTAKENATGKIFQFKVTDAALLRSLKVGQGVYANFSMKQVSLDGSTVCCSIISSGATPPPPLPPAAGSSVNSPASPPTKTNLPAGSGSATTQPGLKTETKPNLSNKGPLPIVESSLNPDLAAALQHTSLSINFTGPGTCDGSTSVDEQSSSLNVRVDGQVKLDYGDNNSVFAEPFPGCTMIADLYKGVQLQNDWSIINAEFGCSTDTGVNIPPGSCEWVSKPSGKSLHGQVSITLPHSFNAPQGTQPCSAKAGPCLLNIVGHIVITLRGREGLNPYPPLPYRGGATATLSRIPGPGSASSPAATGSSSPTGTASASNKVCAGPSTLEGVDVSEYQGTTIDWSKVRASGRTFAYTRATDGNRYVDPSFAQNYAAIKAAGLVRGAYQFFHPEQDPVAQADLALKAIGTLQEGDLPLALDVESTGGQDAGHIAAGINTWMTYVKAKTGRTPILLSPTFYLTQFGSTLSNNPLWAAGYNTSCPTIPSAWQKWILWQYSGTGTVPGLTGQVDLDRFNGTLADLKAVANP
ncbi:MAG TPA: GH25 family lysozyme [Candidatus Dormibacteraeota bacterium]|nr:GH25 family lysozyme [Candidatus Dormibacteraeota bacterium]